jgi:hypothetical protein
MSNDQFGVRSRFGSFRTIATPHHHKMRRLQRCSHGTSYAEISPPVIVEKSNASVLGVPKKSVH